MGITAHQRIRLAAAAKARERVKAGNTEQASVSGENPASGNQDYEDMSVKELKEFCQSNGIGAC